MTWKAPDNTFMLSHSKFHLWYACKHIKQFWKTRMTWLYFHKFPIQLMTPNFALLKWHEYRKRVQVLEGLLPKCMDQNLRLFRSAKIERGGFFWFTQCTYKSPSRSRSLIAASITQSSCNRIFAEPSSAQYLRPNDTSDSTLNASHIYAKYLDSLICLHRLWKSVVEVACNPSCRQRAFRVLKPKT
jgi:hypothetical protein